MASSSWKKEMYQQIANSQVQQVMQQRNQDLQLAQSLIAQYQPNQPNNDDFALAQSLISQYQPQQTAPVQTVNAAPKQQQYIPSLRQEGVNKAVERRQRLSKAENTAIKAEARKEDQKAAFLNRLSGIGDKVNETLLPEEVEALSAPQSREYVMPTAKQDNAVDYSARYSAAPQTNEKARGGKEWNKAVTDTLNQLNSREQKAINKLTAAQNADRKKQEVQTQKNLEAVPEEVVKQYAEKKGVSVEAARAEIEDSIKKASAMNTSLQAPGGSNEVTQQLTQEAQANSAEQKRLAAQKQYTPYETWGLATGKAVSDVVNGPVVLAGKLFGQDWDLYSDIDRERYAQSKEQHPTASNLGTMSGMALAGYAAGGGTGGRALASEGLPTAAEAFNATQGEALLNGAGKTEALLRGLGVAGRQMASNAAKDILKTDLATDIIPTLANDIVEGKSTGEVVGNTVLNTLLNGVFNSVGDIASLVKPVKNSLGGATTKAALNEALDSALEGNTRYAFDNVDDVVRNATLQADEAAQNIENIAKQMPEIPENVPNVAKNIPENVPKNVPVRPGTAAPVSQAIENEAEAMAKAMDAEEAAKAVETPTIKTEIDDMSEVVTNRILDVGYKVDAANNEALNQSYRDLLDYEEKWAKTVSESTDIAEIKQATKDLSNAISRFNTKAKKVDPSIAKDIYNKKFNSMLSGFNTKLDDFYNGARRSNEAADIILKEEAAKIGNNSNVPGAEPLQTFADGQNSGQWRISSARTNTIEKLGWGDQMPEKDFAHRVYSEAEQNADAVARYKDSQNVAADILNKNYEDYDELDVKMAYNEAQRLLDQGDQQSVALAQRLMTKNAAAQRQGGRVVQASAEFTRNTAAGALGDAVKMEEDKIINPWKSKNQKAVAGNSRIAKALAEMGHKTEVKTKPVLTHDQIKEGVIKELNREVGSVEQYFNDSDIEFLTRLAEDKSVPVWQITSEIEHKLNTGSWYTLDEGVDIPKPTNQKLQNALNSLVAEPRAEKAAPSLAQITEEVRNTLAKEFAEGDETLRLFGDDDIEYLANLINNGATKQELADALDHKMATGTFGISAKTMNQVNSIFKEISKFDPNSKQFVEGQAEAYRLLANEVVGDATALEKFEAWRYLAMLGNPKTMLRNFIGNQTFGVVTGISNNLAAMAEAGIDRASKALGGEGIQRTKSVLNPVKDKDLIKAAAEDADVSRYRQIIGSKYEKMDADTLKQSKSVFNSKLLQLYEKVTDAGISDYKAVKNKFSTSLAGYLKANGYGTDIFKAEDELARLKNLGESRLLSNAEKDTIEKLTKDVAELEKARDFALKQAEYATFHEDNAVADALSRASRFLRTSDSKVLNAGGAMLEGVVPFKKTPANVLRSGLEYSPLGAIDSIKKTGKLIYENTGVRKGNLADTYINKKGKEVAKTLASDVIDSWSKTLTGSGLTALGFYLYDKGILNSSDKDLQYQDQLEGKQNYSLTINGKTYTIDWAAPTAMPLLLGAEVAKVWRDSGNDVENWYEHLDEYLNAANRLADPLIETSMLQGVKDTLETAANAAKYDENLNIPTLIAYNTLTGYLTQGIPTVGGQIARTIDPTRRSTYTDKEGVAGTLEKQGRKLMNKVPGLSMLNQPYIDTYGREQQNSPFDNPLANLGYQMFSPGYLAEIKTTDADTMSRDVYEKSGKADNILPKWYSYFKDTEGKRVSPEDFTKASRVAGNIQQTVRNELANDEWFNGLSDADKAEIVDDINTLASNVAKSSIDSEFTSSSKPFNAYKEGGLEGLMNHFKNRYASGVAQESGLNSSTKAAQAIKEDVLNGNTESANEKIEASLSLQDLGLTKPSPTYTYYNAQTVIPGLTTEDFAKTYKAIDSDGNQGIKQDEVIAYLNSKKITSESEAKKIWSAYGSSEWKSIPKLENGKWVKKKK